jgi:endonuclease I
MTSLKEAPPYRTATSETFEPLSVTKGDAARSIFYMSTRYINDIEIIDGNGSESGSNSIGDRATLSREGLAYILSQVFVVQLHL